MHLAKKYTGSIYSISLINLDLKQRGWGNKTGPFDYLGYIHKNNELIKTSFVTWEPNFITLTAEEVLSGQSKSSNRKIAEDILIQELGGEGAIPCKQLYQKAEDQGISKKVLWSASKRLSVKVDKGGFKEGWLWQLPFEIYSEDS